MHGFPPDDMPHREQHDYVDAANEHDQGAGQGKYSVMRWLLNADAPDLTAPPVQEAFQHPTGTGPSGNVADKKPCGNHGHQSPIGAHGADADGDAQEPFWLPHLRLSNLGLDNEQAHSPRVTASSQPGCHLQAVARTPAQLSNKQYPQQQGVSCSGADTPQKEASKLLATVGAVHMPAIARAAAHAKNNSQASGHQGAAQRSAVVPPHAHIVGQVYSQLPCSTVRSVNHVG